MAIDPHLLQEPAPPRPIQVSWAGGRRSIIPYGSFDEETLEEAVAIIAGSSKDFRFSAEGKLEKLERAPDDTDSFDAHFARHSDMFGHDNNLHPDHRDALQAVTAILANAALKEDRSRPLNGSITLRVTPEEKGTRGRAVQSMYDDLIDSGSSNPFDEELPEGLSALLDDLNASTHDCITQMESDLRALRDGESVNLGYPYYDQASGSHLLKEIVKNSRDLRERKGADEEIWRMHNTHPEAANFYFAAKEAEFLLEKGGPAKPIRNIQSFINSYWAQLAGQIDLKVDPTLLERTRDMLRREPLRSREEALTP